MQAPWQRYQTIVFDWDGTLVDSIPRIVTIFRMCFAHFSLEMPSDNAIKATIGLPLMEGFQQLLPGANQSRLNSLRDQYRHFWLSPELAPSALFPGTIRLLEGLQQAGLNLAVATGKSRQGLERESGVHGVRHFFRWTRCAGETQPKPNPHMLLELLEESKSARQASLMIGDSVLDLAMARAAGVEAVGVLSGSDGADALQRHQPRAVITSISDFWTWFRGKTALPLNQATLDGPN